MTYRLRTAALGQMLKVRELPWVCSLGGRSVDGSIQTVAVQHTGILRTELGCSH